ncbi:MAG: hypothetical protein M9894_36605 [Planctomycetes bacterium]|nr:hypothetical protein [Planctomycetota bacterium]
MKGMTIGACALLVALNAGCALISPPSVPGQEQDEPAPQDEGPSYAGTWTRQGEGARVFDVTDDGRTVHGELRGAAEHGFTSYTFDLARKGGKLQGKAKFELADLVGKTYETDWEAKVEGTTILVKAQMLEIDEAGEVGGRSTDEQTYAFEPSAPAAYTPPPMPAMDMSAYVTPMPTYKHLLAEDLAVGQWVEMETDAMGNTSVTRTAVVGDAGDAWILEIDNQMNQKDLLLAVFVDKDTGAVRRAYVGNRGKEGKEKDVPAPPEGQAGEEPPYTDEDVSVPAGTFAARRVDMDVAGSTISTWVGREGTEAEGVMLKNVTPQGTDELKEMGETIFEAKGRSFEARRLVYTSGNEMVMALDRPYLNQVMLQTRMSGVGMKLLAQGDDATPQFDYPR